MTRWFVSVGPELVAGVVLLPAMAGVVLQLTARYYWRDTPPQHGPWGVATAALSGTAFLSGGLAIALISGGPAVYRLGGTVLPEVVFRVDTISIAVGVLNVLLKIGILVYTFTHGPHTTRFYVAYLFFTFAVFGIVLSGDLVAVFIFVLCLIGATAQLINIGGKAGARAAARNYVVTATAGASVYLCGVGIAFWLTGTTSTEQLRAALSVAGYDDPVVVSSFVVMIVGIASLIALFPLHGWLVETHANSADPVSALISGVLPAAATYALSRVVFDVYTTGFLRANPTVADGIIYAAVGGLLIGGVLAYGQRDIKGMLAYSTVSQFGLTITGLMIATETAVFGSITQLLEHGIIKAALCLVAGMIAVRFDARTLDEFGGVASRSPVVAGSFVGLGIALIGLPPMGGFVGKWNIAVAALEEGYWIVSLFVVVSTVITLGYVIRFIDQLYFASFNGPDDGGKRITAPMQLVVVLAVVLSLAIGLGSVFLEQTLRDAIGQLITADQR